MMMRDTPEPGDIVRVPFGGAMIDARVQYVRDMKSGRHIAVELYVEYCDEPLLDMYHIDQVEPWEPAV